jgi:hypothetical protein
VLLEVLVVLPTTSQVGMKLKIAEGHLSISHKLSNAEKRYQGLKS